MKKKCKKSSLLFFFYLFLFGAVYAQERNISAIVKDQYGVKWNNLKAALYINQNDNDFSTATLYDSIFLSNGVLTFLGITPTSNQTIKKDLNVIFYPNPFSDKIRINQTFTENGILNIYNIEGRKVKSFTMQGGIQNHEFDVNGLHEGIYLCELVSANERFCAKMLRQNNAGNGTGRIQKTVTKSSSKEKIFGWLQFSATDAIKTTFAFEIDGTVNLGDIKVKRKQNTFVDERDGNEYEFTNIGNQTWMAENLAWLPRVVGPDSSSNSIPYYYVYDFNDTIVSSAKATEEYQNSGVLYNLSAAKESCPAGWRLPSRNDWDSLAMYIQQENDCPDIVTNYGWYMFPEVGKYLKSDSGWLTFNGNNKYNFNGTPDGFVAWGSFNSNNAMYWSSTESLNNPDYAWAPDLGPEGHSLDVWHTESNQGKSVRCIADLKITDTLEILHSTIGPEGGKIELGEFIFEVPKNCFEKNYNLEFSLNDKEIDEYNKLSNVLTISGVPQNFSEDIKLTILDTKNDSATVVIGAESYFTSIDDTLMDYVPVDTEKTDEGYITYLSSANNEKSVNSTTNSISKKIHVAMIDGRYHYTTKDDDNHFQVVSYMYADINMPLTNIIKIATYAKNAYDKYTDPGVFNLGFSRSWPMKLYLKEKLINDVNGLHSPGGWITNSYININKSILNNPDKLRTTVAHELMHEVQERYGKSNNKNVNLMLREAMSVYIEEYFAEEPSFVSSAWKNSNGRIYDGIRPEIRPDEVKETRRNYQFHGYAFAAYLKYLIENKGYGLKLIKELLNGDLSYISDINTAMRRVKPNEDESIRTLFGEFIHEYLNKKIYADRDLPKNAGSSTLFEFDINQKIAKSTFKAWETQKFTIQIKPSAITENTVLKITTNSIYANLFLLTETESEVGRGMYNLTIDNLKSKVGDSQWLYLMVTNCSGPTDANANLTDESEIEITAKLENGKVECQIDWVVTGRYEFDNGSEKDTSIVYATDIIPLNILLEKTGPKTYTSTFDHKSPFGGSYFAKGQFSITINKNSRVDISLNVTDSYIRDQTNEHKNRKYKIIAKNILYEKTLGTDVKYDFYKLGSSGFWNHVEKFEFSETNVEISTGNTRDIKFVEPWDHNFNEIYIRLTYQ